MTGGGYVDGMRGLALAAPLLLFGCEPVEPLGDVRWTPKEQAAAVRMQLPHGIAPVKAPTDPHPWLKAGSIPATP